MEGLRAKMVRFLYKAFPFSLRGDAVVTEPVEVGLISCVINFYGRLQLLEGILYSLYDQQIGRDKFEVILVEDRGGTSEGRKVAEKFSRLMNIRYFAVSDHFGLIGYSTNLGLLKARGEYVLFLDDDTVILQKDFLSTLVKEFERTGADGVIPKGTASYSIVKGRYGFHDPYFPSNRCMAYRREVLDELGGFVSDMTGQEDVEFVVRFIASSKKYHRSDKLQYFHPPFVMDNLNKAKAVGLSFSILQARYPFLVWLFLVLNGIRFMPKLLLPLSMKWKFQGRFSLGFLVGVYYGITGRKIGYR